MKRFLAFIVGLLVVIGAAVYAAVHSNAASSYAITTAAEQAKLRGIKLAIGQAELSLIGVRAHNIEAFIPRALFSVTIDELAAAVSLRELLSFRFPLHIESALYKGSLTADGWYESASQRGSLQFHLDGVNLDAHPQLAGFGITKGRLSAASDNFSFDDRGLQGSLLVEIRRLDKPIETKLAIPVPGGTIPVLIPAVKNFSASTTLSFGLTSIDFKDIDSSSSLGTFKAHGVISHGPQKTDSTMHLEGVIHLTEEGAASIGPYLMLLGAPSTAITTPLQLSVDGPLRAPIARVSRMASNGASLAQPMGEGLPKLP